MYSDLYKLCTLPKKYMAWRIDAPIRVGENHDSAYIR